MKKAVVTGANGFVGAATCKTLIHHGVDVIAVVRDGHSDLRLIKNFDLQIVRCPLNNFSELQYIICDADIDCFFHMAWDGVSGDNREDVDLQINNVRGTLDAVKAASGLGCKKFVGIGSTAEKDVASYIDANGSTPNAVSHYGIAKIASRYFTKTECNRLGMDCIWVTLSNLYGEGDFSKNFINFVIDTFVSHKAPDFTSGIQFYDFTHIDDAAEGIYLSGEKGKKNYSYYIGSGKPRRLKEYIECIRDCIDPGILINFGAIPYHGTEKSDNEYSIKETTEDIGYIPKIAFEDGIKVLIDSKWRSR